MAQLSLPKLKFASKIYRFYRKFIKFIENASKLINLLLSEREREREREIEREQRSRCEKRVILFDHLRSFKPVF